MDDEQRKAIGRRISHIRDYHGKTLEEFGKIIDNANKSNVSKWEKGDVLPNRNRLRMIADYHGIHINELLYGGLEAFASSIFFDEIQRYLNKYKDKDSGYLITSHFDLDEVNAKFRKWLEENLQTLTYDDEKEIRRQTNALIAANIQENKGKTVMTDTMALDNISDKLSGIRIEARSDFFQGMENSKGEIELSLREGMSQEVYEAVDSILETAVRQLLTLKYMLTSNK